METLNGPSGVGGVRTALQALPEEVVSFLETMPGMIWVLDEEGRCLNANAAAASWSGRTKSEMRGRAWRAWVYRGDRDLWSCAWPKLARGEPLSLRMRLCATPGEALWVEVHGRSWERARNGAGSFVVVTVRSVGSEMEIERHLRQFGRCVEQSPSSIVVTDRSGMIEYVNPRFTEVTGYALGEVVGENPRILKSGHFGSDEYRMLWETICRGEVWKGEFHNRKKSGELYWEAASIAPVRGLDGEISHFVAVKEDITARKTIEAEREKLIRDLRDALAKVKTLSGLVPICAQCKKIRDDQGYWNRLESYIQSHSSAVFSHGLCPECSAGLLEELAELNRRKAVS